MHEKGPYSKFFSSAFSCIRTNYGDIRSIFPYSVWMRENTDQNDSNTDTFHAVYLIKKASHFAPGYPKQHVHMMFWK